MPGRRTRTTIGLLFSYVRGRFLEHPRVWLLPQSNPDGSGPLAQGSRITPGPLVTDRYRMVAAGRVMCFPLRNPRGKERRGRSDVSFRRGETRHRNLVFAQAMV